jgi:hypothetical protein
MHQIWWPFVCIVSSRYFTFLEKTSEFALLLLLLLFPFKFAMGVISLQYGFMLLMWNMVASEVLCWYVVIEMKVVIVLLP